MIQKKYLSEMEFTETQVPAILNWSSNQGEILTGEGLLNKVTKEGRDYAINDLPHYYLVNRKTKKVFKEWLQSNRRSFEIVGAWGRPLFSGGYKESTLNDTEAFNLQTPSFFIDMRFPLSRPTDKLKASKSLEGCSEDDLRYLARQHCFAGFSLPSIPSSSSTVSGPCPTHFTRHHIIDWNFHPSFPRPRPNKWWISTDLHKQQLKADEEKIRDRKVDQQAIVPQSFKEFSFARDQFNVPVYFERWARYKEDSNGQKYLACRRNIGCPVEALKAGNVPERDALLIIIGNHFAFIEDRPSPMPDFEGANGPGGAALVDYALSRNMKEDAIRYLDIEGSYGKISQKNSEIDGSCDENWIIKKSTHPWKEERSFLNPSLVEGIWNHENELFLSNRGLEFLVFNGFVWTVFESSFTEIELQKLFPNLNSSLQKRSKL